MKYTVTSPASTRKALEVTFETADVASSIDKAVGVQQRDFSMPGFRKGKVPFGIIEKRFGEELYAKATQVALDDFLSSTLKEEKLHPLSAVDMEKSDGVFKRGAEFHCTLSFDVLPEIELPTIEGLEVEQVKASVSDDDVKSFIGHMHADMADLVPLKIARAPQDGDQVNATYEGFDNEHKPIDGVKGTFDLVVGKGQVIPDFEALIRTILPGAEKEGDVTFPVDYHAKDLAGKTIVMKVKVNDVKERRDIPMDDAFARKVGAESLEKLDEMVKTHLLSQQQQAAKGTAMGKLLDAVMASAPAFDIPAGLVDARLRRTEGEFQATAREAGKPVEEKKLEELRNNARPEIENELRPQVMLMAIARAKDLEVTDQEVEMHIYMTAMRAGQDPRRLAEMYQRSGMINELRDRLLAEKGLKFIYDAAKVTEIEPAAPAAGSVQAEETPKES